MKKLPLRRDNSAVFGLKPAAVLLILPSIILCGVATRAWAAPAATSTTLAITSANGAVTAIDPGSVIALTATVGAETTPVTTGQVKFCDAAATYCTDIHLLGTEQLTSAGTATLRFVPGIGSHSYKAVFLGTTTNASSTSNHAGLTVTGTATTTTSITASGSAGNYSLRATVSGAGRAQPPTGTVSFLDASSANFVVASAVLGASSMKLSFLNPPTPVTGVGPWSVASADFNGDGVLDLAAANKGDNSVTILLGEGSGTFSPAPNSPVTVGSGPISIAVGDFNGDGIADLAVANYGSPKSKGTLTVLLGGGDGSFTQASGSPVMTGILPRSVAVADLNGDGIADLGVANFGDSTVSILLGNGDGTFSSAPNSPVTVGPTPYSVAVADFNGDGVPDLAVANGSTNTVNILLGNGDGTFTAAANSPVTPGYAPTFVAAGDFNGDGKTDLAAVNNGNGTVTIFLGNGDGSFSQAASSPVTVGVSPYAVVVGDFNGDGIADLAAANSCGNGPTCQSLPYKGTMTVLLGDEKGAFIQAANSPLPVGIQPLSLAAGDFNGDGIVDLAVANYSSGTVTVVTGQWTQTATATASGIALLGAGTRLIDASYPGDDTYASSLSTTTGLTAQKGTPSLTVTPDSSGITSAQALTVTVFVDGGSGNPAPTGSVTLTSGSYTSAVTPLASHSAQINIPAGSLATGSDTLSAGYTPDSDSSSIYNSSLGTAAVTVTSAVSPSFTLGATAVTLVAGATTGNTSTISLTPSGGFTGSVGMTAAITSSPTGAQYPPTLSFGATSPVSITGTPAGTASLTISTTAATDAVLVYLKTNGLLRYAAGGSSLACILLFGIPARRRKWQTTLGMLALLAAFTSGVLACGGGSKSPGSGGTGTPGTTAGNYTVTVTGTSGTTTSTSTVSLTVQ